MNPEIKLSSVAALGWAKRICEFSYQNGGKCHYDHVEVIVEFIYWKYMRWKRSGTDSQSHGPKAYDKLLLFN